jgi:hypothetical protein
MNMQRAIGADTLIRRSEELVASDLEGETVMMSVRSGMYYGLDSIGSRLWQLIEQPRSVSELCDILLQEYAVERAQCERDVIALLNEMHGEGIVDVLGAAAA